MKLSRYFKKSVLPSAVTLALGISQTVAFSGPLESDLQPSVEIVEDERPPLLDVKFDTSMSFAGETEFRGEKYGDSDAYNFNFSASTFLPLSESFMVPVGFESQNFMLDQRPGIPMPDSIHTLEFSTGIAWLASDNWMVMSKFNATLYNLDDINSDSIGYSGGLMVEWQYSDAMKWVLFAMYQPDNDMPFIGLIGLEWMINDNWDLHLNFPRPRLIYSPGEKWRFHVGMDLNLGTTFSTSKTFGSEIGLPEFDNELGSYTDIRAGGGIDYQLSKSFSLEAEAGYSMNREIDYADLDEKVEFDSAPYIRLGLKYEF